MRNPHQTIMIDKPELVHYFSLFNIKIGMSGAYFCPYIIIICFAACRRAHAYLTEVVKFFSIKIYCEYFFRL